MKALIVESDPPVQARLREALEARGHEVAVIGDGAEAWKACQRELPPLIIIDEATPAMDGLQLCRRIRSLPDGDGAFVLMITDEGSSSSLPDVLEVGADDFVTKPLDLGTLYVRLAIAERDALARTGRRRREVALRETDRRLSAVIANAPVGIVALDTDGAIRSIKGRALETFGIRASRHIGQSIAAIFRDQPVVGEAVQRTLKGVSAVCLVERDSHRLEIRWSPEVGPDGDVTGALGVVVGIPDKTEPAVAQSDDDADSPSDTTVSFHGQIGRSQVMRVLFAQIRDVARVDWTVLIEGETGSGKELAARAIHLASSRVDKPFIAVNCASLTDSLLASQLFGHRRGSFTGAVSDQEGLFEAANGGTLFLDEIGEVSRAVQVSLLRVLESREITRVGETKVRKVDVRIIAATNRKLAEAVAEGSFRADLFYRLRIARLRIPPLRERVEDIPDLVWHFLDLSRDAIGKPIADIDPMAMDLLTCHQWPGNVRELKAAVDYAVLRCQGTVIARNDLPDEILEGCTAESPRLAEDSDPRTRLVKALKEAGGNRSKAARLLGVSRATFYRYLSRFGIDESS